MYKQDLALNNPQGLICLKTQPANLYCHGLNIFNKSSTMILLEQFVG